MNIRTLRPSYFCRRVAQYRFEKAHPDAPWLTPIAVSFLSNWLKESDVGFEWGSGRSTVWLAARCASVISVEHDLKWYDRVKETLSGKDHGANVDYRFIPCELGEMDEPAQHAYADAILQQPDSSFDWILVDGMIRLTCIGHAINKLKAGGALILDNANRYIPNRFDGVFSTIQEHRDAAKNAKWQQFLDGLRDWRWFNASNRIWDTRFWFKPGER